MTRTPSTVFLLLIAIPLLLAACGKSKSSLSSSPSSTHTAALSRTPLSRTQFVSDIEAICRAANAKRDLTEKDELPGFIAGRLAAQRSETAELEKLTPPSSMVNDWNKIVAGSREFISDLVKIERYATSKNAKLPASLLKAGGAAQGRMMTIAKRDGLSQCSKVD